MNSLHARPFFEIAKVQSKVFILDSNSEYVVLARRKIVFSEKKYMIGDCSLSNQMPQTDQII